MHFRIDKKTDGRWVTISMTEWKEDKSDLTSPYILETDTIRAKVFKHKPLWLW